FLSRFYPDGFKEQIVPWCNFTTEEGVTLLSVSLLSWMISVISFAEVRCGNPVNSQVWQKLSLLVNGHLRKLSQEKARTFLTESAALSYLHWRDSCSGVMRMVGIAAGTLVIVVCLVVFYQDGGPSGRSIQILNDNAFLILNLLIGICALMLGLLLGTGLNDEKRPGMKSWLAVLPLSDHGLAAVLLRNLLKVAALILAWIMIGIVFSWLIAKYGFQLNLFRKEDFSQIFSMGIYQIGAFWVLSANLVSLMWTGRNWFILSIVSAFISCVFAIPILQLILHLSEIQSIDKLVVSSLVMLLISGNIIAFTLAYIKKLIPLQTIVSCILFFAMAVFLCYPVWNVNSVWEKVGCSSLLLPIFTPFATIPLAVSWNRHQ
ncbi:MAG: hypothetical protein KDA77_10620, partial [Planctomycetaceae bacterium]|nr:hypothetical protein [Planctomycetaceae bacterium]